MQRSIGERESVEQRDWAGSCAAISNRLCSLLDRGVELVQTRCGEVCYWRGSVPWRVSVVESWPFGRRGVGESTSAHSNLTDEQPSHLVFSLAGS